ncbi:peptidase C39 [Paraburkholderia sp. MMS20-SJTR3]|uniref:Peptidase C39 n=1 Tax=Paraburkholderia sejongensis TaxID=2886946 RepID=A0ABS8JYP0_9BURK|nr:peptidase C39 [Paraburkholderia sp. MMS20-SJTR3]MCC8395027.1 peptidase C39 [Paraburkholderia sp. MMS20-SJTR3]
MKSHLKQLGVVLCAVACGTGGSALASEGGAAPAAPDLSIPRAAGAAPLTVQLVGDDVLAAQTGKYAGATMISGFVLNVISQWRLPNGVSALAQGTLSATQNARGQLVSSIGTSASVTGDTHGRGGRAADWGANPDAYVSGGQSVSVNGVSQVTQVAGDRNSGVNSALIDFNNNAVTLAASANAPAASASNSTGSVKAGISFGSNGVNVTLQTPAGLATQTIAPANGQIAQLLQIAGNNQQVANALQLHLQTQQMSASMLRQLGVLQALQNRR